MPTVLLAPVGLYWKRVLTSIRVCKPQKIYLLLATGDHGWPKKTEQNVKRLKTSLMGLYDDEVIKVKRAHFGSFSNVFRKVNQIISSETRRYATMGKQVDFWLDITSAPTLPRMAIVSISALYMNTHVHYTPTREAANPYSDYVLGKVENDPGGSPKEIPIVRSRAYLQIQRKRYFADALKCLVKQRHATVASQAQLMRLLGLDASSRQDYMMIGRVIKELQDLGLVSTVRVEEGREKEVRLTVLGVAIASTTGGGQ